MYLVCCFMGSCLHFYRIVEHHGAWVKLDRGDNVAYRKGRYFTRIYGWETVTYSPLKNIDEVISYINKNFDRLKDLDCDYSCTNKTAEDCKNETLVKLGMRESEWYK